MRVCVGELAASSSPLQQSHTRSPDRSLAHNTGSSSFHAAASSVAVQVPAHSVSVSV